MTINEMKSAIYEAHKTLSENEFDFPFDNGGKTYSIKICDQSGKTKANPNRYHLVDYRFDVYFDRYDRDFQIVYGPANAERDTNACTRLASYKTAAEANRAVDMLTEAFARRDSEFTFPTFA